MLADDIQDSAGVGGFATPQRDLHHAGALVPLPEQPAPRRLGPSGVGHRPMAVAGAQVMPESRGRNVTRARRTADAAPSSDTTPCRW